MAKRVKRTWRSRASKTPELAFPTRLQPGQFHLIAKVKNIRSEANELRTKVSAGSYGDSEREHFYKLANNAGIILRVSNPELAQRAGLGDGFFSTLVRDKRNPKLKNFLRALTAIIEVADERLFDVDRDPAISGALPPQARISQRIKQDRENLLLLAQTLSKMALDEIEKLDAERPNDPDRIKGYEKQRELLQIFANGFARIAQTLAALDLDITEPVKLGRAAKAIEIVGNKIERYWKKYEDETIDWAIRIPVITAGVAALGWAGANMLVGTTAVAALVGGKKVLEAIGKRGGKTKLNKK